MLVREKVSGFTPYFLVIVHIILASAKKVLLVEGLLSFSSSDSV
jgi:hypothetical protein